MTLFVRTRNMCFTISECSPCTIVLPGKKIVTVFDANGGIVLNNVRCPEGTVFPTEDNICINGGKNTLDLTDIPTDFGWHINYVHFDGSVSLFRSVVNSYTFQIVIRDNINELYLLGRHLCRIDTLNFREIAIAKTKELDGEKTEK